jgi:hypothetical protein
MLQALMFLLDHVIKHGDAPASAQATRHKQILAEETAALSVVQSLLPHDGVQSPQSKVNNGLGSTNQTAAAPESPSEVGQAPVSEEPAQQ